MTKIKLTLSIDDEIIIEAKQVCIAERTNVSKVVQDFLKTYIEITKQPAKKGSL